jgi:ferritin
MNIESNNVGKLLNHAVVELNKLGHTSFIDAIIKQDYQIKRLEGLLQEAYKEVRRVENTIEKLEATTRRVEGRLYQLESYYGE